MTSVDVQQVIPEHLPGTPFGVQLFSGQDGFVSP